MASRSLTGGSGDVNPQWTTANITLAAPAASATAVAEVTINTNAGRIPFGTKNQRALVMEVLKVQWIPQFTLNGPGSTLTAGIYEPYLSTRPMSGLAVGVFVNAANSTVAIERFRISRMLVTSGAFDLAFSVSPIIDLTDGNGHGVLVASPQLYAGMILTNSTSADLFDAGVDQFCACRVLYRWKEVGLEEFLGIAQGQLGS